MSGTVLRGDLKHAADDLHNAIGAVRVAAAAEVTAWGAYEADVRILSTHEAWQDAERRLTAAKGKVLTILEDLTGADWGST
jgi:hypothetical protein